MKSTLGIPLWPLAGLLTLVAGATVIALGIIGGMIAAYSVAG